MTDQPYTPSIGSVKNHYVHSMRMSILGVNPDEIAADFDRMIEAVRAEVRAEAEREYKLMAQHAAKESERAEKAEAERDEAKALARDALEHSEKSVRTIEHLEADRDVWKRNYQQVEGELHQMGARAVEAEAERDALAAVVSNMRGLLPDLWEEQISDELYAFIESILDADPAAVLAELGSGQYKVTSIRELRRDALQAIRHYPIAAGERWLNDHP